jgi:hypothetical protein
MQKIQIPVHEKYFLTKDFQKRPDEVNQVYFQKVPMWTKKELGLAALAIGILLVAITTVVLCFLALIFQDTKPRPHLHTTLHRHPVTYDNYTRIYSTSTTDPEANETLFTHPERHRRSVNDTDDQRDIDTRSISDGDFYRFFDNQKELDDLEKSKDTQDSPRTTETPIIFPFELSDSEALLLRNYLTYQKFFQRTTESPAQKLSAPEPTTFGSRLANNLEKKFTPIGQNLLDLEKGSISYRMRNTPSWFKK